MLTQKHKRIMAWVAAASLTLGIAVGNSHSRMKEWTSTEMVFTPTVSATTENGYGSDCLVAGGQTIILADWDSATPERTVVIGISRPAGAYTPQEPENGDDLGVLSRTVSDETDNTEEPVESETPEEPTEPTEPEEPTKPDEPTAPEEPEVPVISEVKVTTDSPYLTCVATVAERTITLVLTRLSPVGEVTNATVHVAWKGLEGMISVNLLPENMAPSQEEENGTGGVLTVDSCGVMNPATKLAYIRLESGAERVSFSQNGQTLNMVRCSLDLGESYLLFYDGGGILPLENAPEDWNGVLLVDFSMALTGDQDVTVTANSAEGFGTCTLTMREKTEVSPLFLKGSNLPYPISVHTVWGTAAVQLQVQKLGTDAEGQFSYINTDTVTAVFSESAVIIKANGQPEPGTYRLVIQWIWNNISVEEQSIYFVINTK